MAMSKNMASVEAVPCTGRYGTYVQDEYLTHRVVHSVESALWIKLSSSSADLTIYAGDFNTEPKVPYHV